MQNLIEKMDAFHLLIESELSKLKAETKPFSRFKIMTEAMVSLSQAVIEIGDYSREKIDNSPKSLDFLPFYFVDFVWNPYAKSFLILWRNVLFEEQKAQFLVLEKRIGKPALSKLQNASVLNVEKAAEELKMCFKNDLEEIKKAKGGGLGQIRKWALQNNPQSTYREQFMVLPRQCEDLSEQCQLLKNMMNYFTKIRHLIKGSISNSEKDIEGILNQAKNAINFIETNLASHPGKIRNQLENPEVGNKLSDSKPKFYAELESIIQNLVEKSNLIVAISGGKLQQRDVNFKRSVRQWMDAEVLPSMNEIWELNDDLSNSLKMSMANIRNRMLHLSSEPKEMDQPQITICQPLFDFIDKVKQGEASFGKWKNTIETRMEASFFVSAIFNLTKNFLPVPLQSALGQYRLGGSKWYQTLEEWWKKQSGLILRVKASVEEEESLSKSEKIARCIQSRTLSSTNDQYTSIFMTSGHIGESFWVGRDSLLKRLENLVDQWNHGFRGSVILTGDRFSGKTFFGDFAANRFFQKKIIRLAPNTSFDLSGRKFKTSYDLGSALDFVQKNALQSKMLIWLDDLEVWSSPEISLAQNVRMLKHFIDRYANHLFFLVSMSNWTKSHLEKMQEIGKAFQAEINLDSMSIPDIQKAIFIRHGATHKRLVDENGDEANLPSIKKMTKSIIKRSGNNIGESLRNWAVAARMVDEDRVRITAGSNYSLPDFINPDVGILLSSIMIEKYSNEYRLRKLFGSAFQTKYSHIIVRLIGIGILQRKMEGWIELNPVIVNQVGNWLENKNYLIGHKL